MPAPLLAQLRFALPDSAAFAGQESWDPGKVSNVPTGQMWPQQVDSQPRTPLLRRAQLNERDSGVEYTVYAKLSYWTLECFYCYQINLCPSSVSLDVQTYVWLQAVNSSTVTIVFISRYLTWMPEEVIIKLFLGKNFNTVFSFLYCACQAVSAAILCGKNQFTNTSSLEFSWGRKQLRFRAGAALTINYKPCGTHWNVQYNSEKYLILNWNFFFFFTF